MVFPSYFRYKEKSIVKKGNSCEIITAVQFDENHLFSEYRAKRGLKAFGQAFHEKLGGGKGQPPRCLCAFPAVQEQGLLIIKGNGCEIIIAVAFLHIYFSLLQQTTPKSSS